MKTWSFVAVLALGAVSARAEDTGRFGAAGEVVPSGSLLSTSVQTSVSIQPMVQYFIVPNVAVGLGLSYARSSFSGQPTTNTYGVAPSIGYNLRLADNLSIFPQIVFSAQHTASSGPSNIIVPTGGIALDAFVPVLFHPVRHFFLGIGPQISTAGPSSNLFKDQALVVHTVIGGWF